ncbi:ATP-binding protein, partial [Klebsiella pneumoniae]|nr:ATP-binding protein [Klebsiella pneumoniae]
LYFMRSLRELLYNAAKYSDGQHVAIILSQTDNTILFTVQDTGAGIPTDYRDLMFTPFTKVNDLSEGLGLGLPLSMRHILNLGGKLY